MDIDNNRRIHTPTRSHKRIAPKIYRTEATAGSQNLRSNGEVIPKVITQERRSGKDRRQGGDSRYADLRSGRDRRRSHRLSVKV
jgi:hypothetical protein